MFDAGAIEARLTVDRSQFNKELAGAEADVKAFENRRHQVKITAVFDDTSTSKARQGFAQLDNAISKDAMNRLRSSPNGSVLGALNALFSPHPVTGAPSPQQSAQQGLLGKIISAPAAGSAPGGGSRSGPTNGTILNTVASAASPGGTTTTTTTRVSSVGAPKIPGGGGSSGGNNNTSGGGFFGNLAKGIGPGILGLGVKTAGIGALGAAALGGLGPILAGAGVLGLGAAGAGVIGLGAKSLIGTKNVAGQAPTQGPLFAQGQAAGAALKAGLISAESGLIGPLGAALKGVPALVAGVVPALRTLFSGAATLIVPLEKSLSDLAKQILPALGNAFRVVAPLIRPLLDGLGSLVANILPGVVALLKVAGPAIGVFAQVLGTLGKDIGGVFSAFVPVITQSTVLFKAIFDVLGSLLPIVGKLAAIFAAALAPVFVQFASVIKALLPFLTIIGKVFAALAGAVLGDLVAAFGALAQLLTAVAPSLTQFAQVISRVFTVLENTGVFAILGDALEGLVKPLAKLIDAFLRGLMPILPPIITFIAQLSGLLVTSLVSAVGALLPPLTTLVTGVLQALTVILPVILPLLLAFAGIFTASLVQVITTLATALGDIINAIPPAVLGGIILGILGIVGAMKAFAVISALLALDPPVLIFYALVAAAAALVIGITELVTHWSAVWGAIKAAAADAWNFIYNGFGKYLLPLLGPAGLLALAAIELYQHWRTIWTDIKTVVSGVVTFFTTAWAQITSGIRSAWNAITTFFTTWWNTEVTGWKTTVSTIEGVLSGAWTLITNALKTAWNAITAFFTGWWAALTASFRSTVSTAESILSTAWNSIYATVVRIWGTIIAFFRGVPGTIGNAVGNAAKVLTSWGAGVINGLLAGVKSVWNGVVNFFKGIPGDILHALGIHSPPQWAIDAGKHIMEGLGIGLSKASGVVNAVKAVINSIHGYTLNASQASVMALMKQMAAARGWTGAQWTALNAVEMAEAGYNPNAKNPTSNAYGLAQFINGPSEYAQYGGNVNTVAGQITGMLNYIAQRYGTPVAAWNHEASQHWYGMGGMVTEPVIGYGLASGQMYGFGESGTEVVTPLGGKRGWDGASSDGTLARIDARLAQLVDISAQAPAATGRHVGGVINGAASAASFRNRYPRGGS